MAGEAAAAYHQRSLPSELLPPEAAEALAAPAEDVPPPASVPPLAEGPDGQEPDGLGKAPGHPLEMGSAEPAAAAGQAAAPLAEAAVSPVATQPAATQASQQEATGALNRMLISHSPPCPSSHHQQRRIWESKSRAFHGVWFPWSSWMLCEIWPDQRTVQPISPQLLRHASSELPPGMAEKFAFSGILAPHLKA